MSSTGTRCWAQGLFTPQQPWALGFAATVSAQAIIPRQCSLLTPDPAFLEVTADARPPQPCLYSEPSSRGGHSPSRVSVMVPKTAGMSNPLDVATNHPCSGPTLQCPAVESGTLSCHHHQTGRDPASAIRKDAAGSPRPVEGAGSCTWCEMSQGHGKTQNILLRCKLSPETVHREDAGLRGD